MDILSETWGELRNNVKRCGFTNCPRNRDETPIFFERSEDSLSRVKFLVLSQEPGANLRNEVPSEDPDEMEDYLLVGCGEVGPKGNNPINKIVKIFCHNFNPSTDEIYWTHALKCVPRTNNQQINSDWGESSKCCKQYLINELKLLPAKELMIVAMGNYALALCLHILMNRSLFNVRGIMKYIREVDINKSFTLGGKRVFLYPFIHPSKREMVLKRWDHDGKVAKKEEEFIRKIRKNLEVKC